MSEPMIKPETAAWLAQRFHIPVEQIRWYNGGICYDRIQVLSKEAADKVTEAVKDDHVNGGWYHGMPLGGQTQYTSPDGTVYYDVMC